MRYRTTGLATTTLLLTLLAVLAVVPANANGPYNWTVMLIADGGKYGGGGCYIGTNPGASDAYNGAGAVPDDESGPGVISAFYRENGVASGTEPVWLGGTGFYSADGRGPIPAGGSKTYSGIYLWAQKVTLDPSNQITFWVGGPDAPTGCKAHLVLDQVPASAGWTGPTDFWFDHLDGQANHITLPIAVVTDPLQGTEMHITVYATPEPSSLLALGLGLLPLAGAAFWRTRPA